VLLPVMGFAALLTVLLALLTWQVSPEAAGRVLEVRSEALRAGQFAPITAGRFRTFGGGSTVVYAQSADKDGTLRRVFVERDRGGYLEVALAQRATHAYSDAGDLHVITLYDGQRYEGVPGERKFRIVRFAENTIPVRLPALAGGAVNIKGVSTRVLAASSDPKARAEFHWRIAVPVMALVLAIIAVPIARLRPRQGRYARVGYAILIYFVYFNLISAGKVWIERGVAPEWLGLWWVHLAVALLAAAILYAPRWLQRARYQRRTRAATVPA
jgi:lipopolysaccharide export system permease protein